MPPCLANPRPLTVTELEPRLMARREPQRWFADFGLAYFGTVRVTVQAAHAGTAEICLGEKLNEAGGIDRTPPGSIRCRIISLALQSGTHIYQATIPPDARNTGAQAIRMPQDLFEVMPFRYSEVTIANGTLVAITMLAVHVPFDAAASAFTCSDSRLNRVWELCKHSIKATSFCGVYVDGDRERIPYEADAYINQLSHYGVDREYELARHTFEHLLCHPTWPTEWALHFVPLAWADYTYTGRTDLLETYYDALREKLLLPLSRADSLISTTTGLLTPELLTRLHLNQPMSDIVDWPPGSFTQGGTGERDNHDMRPINTVVNAFHVWNLALFVKMARLLNRTQDALFFERRATQVTAALLRVALSRETGLFVDGEDSSHSSLHANLFPAAFGLVPAEQRARILAFIRSRGMACSVYGAQYLLEAAYRLGDPGYALELMTAEHDRGWINMLRSGSTVTLEAWDWRYKNNLDWNHAWGAAPANIIPRFVAGVRPAEPGFSTALVAPQPGRLEHLASTVPTCRGPVQIAIEQPRRGHFRLTVESPVPIRLDLSGLTAPDATVRLAGAASCRPSADGTYKLAAGRHEIGV